MGTALGKHVPSASKGATDLIGDGTKAGTLGLGNII